VIGTLTMTAGTAVGGWRIIKTLGNKPVHLRPIRGFVAETSGGIAYGLLRLLQVLSWD
jgi:PiT family inorganic phosphate transporter